MRTVLSAAGLAALIGAAVLSPVPAHAAAGPEPWEPWKQEEWRAEAGIYCDFAIQLRVVSQDIERRTLERHDDGTIRREEYRGPLDSYFVNEDTGKTFRTDAGGKQIMEYYPNGDDKAMTTIGPVGNGFTADAAYPRGYYLMDGFHHVTWDRDGIERIAVDGGEEIDVCKGLS